MKSFKIFIFLMILGTVSGLLLVGVNSATAPLIIKNEDLKLKSAVLDAFDISFSKPEVMKIFGAQVKTLYKEERTFYTISDGSVAFAFGGPGLWGPISGIICLKRDLKTISRIRIIHQEETPGLGGRIAEAGYLAQFRDKEVLPRLVFTPEGTSSSRNEVDAITGATGIDMIKGSRIYIEETICNLLANSIKYTPPNGKVAITAGDNGSSVLIKVSDNGIGIPKDELGRIFEEFYRASNARAEERDGTGLGLAIAKQVMRMHKGKIWVNSEEGKGSVFSILLPKGS